MIADGPGVTLSIGIHVADDAGALLVRSGLVPPGALDDARTRVDSLGGTIGEQLVATGAVSDDALTDFYKSRLLVPQVNPNTLARLPAKVVAVIPSDMAIELRAIPVSIDSENNLTIAMSDPSDRHAVDEIAFFTGAYVVRAVATQMQIAWCLAHYYGHVTHLGQRLLQPTAQPHAQPQAQAMQAAVRTNPRARGITDKVDAERHKALVPGEPMRTRQRRAGAELRTPAPPVGPRPEADTAVVQDPDAPPARSVSGEIRVPVRRAPSIKPPLPDDDEDDDVETGPVISFEMDDPSGPVTEESEAVMEIEAEAADETTEAPTGRAKPAPRRLRPAEPDPPELAARGGEIAMRAGPERTVDHDEPRVVIAEDVDPAPIVSGEIAMRQRADSPVVSNITVEVSDEASEPVVIHEQPLEDSTPIVLDRRRPADPVVMLDSKKTTPFPVVQRKERRTQVGIGANTAATRAKHDTLDSIPPEVDDGPTQSTVIVDNDPTRVDTYAIPPGDATTSDEILAAPPSPMGDDDTSPHLAPPSRQAAPGPSGQIKLDGVRRAPTPDEEDEDEEEIVLVPRGKATMVMSAVELDAAIPERRVDYDPVDDGWGPPGTTIPPPLLGAIPGTIEPRSGIIPMPSMDGMDDTPLMVAPPVPPEPSRSGGVDVSPAGLVRALEEATVRVLELISQLDRATDRDQVVAAMVSHLAESHRRTGFFAARGGELGVFTMSPKPPTMPIATLRLDRPSTLQDVIGTRLPYRGPTTDDASHTFLTSVLGACPAEILLVPVVVRERVVGILFGEHRLRHTFDDQLALAARAAGLALERILKAKRT